MEITFAATPSWAEENSIVTIKVESGETISVGDFVNIELVDETFVKKEVISMRRWFGSEGAKRGKWKDVDSITEGESAEITLNNIKSNTIQTTSMPSAAERRRMAEMICISPFKEIHCGKESIYDYVEEGCTVPDKVIVYLRTTKPYLMSPGIYDHPFKKDTRLLGPYMYTDDKYYWDRDTWKYVLKYHVKLPIDFINHVMSDAGTEFIEKQMSENTSWAETIKEWKKGQGGICLLPDDAGDKELDDF